MTFSATAATADTMTPDRRPLLEVSLKLDAVVTGLNGAAYLVAASALDGLLGLPTSLLRGVGVFLLAYAVGVWLVATRHLHRAGATGAVIEANLVWVVVSLATAVFSWGTPSTVGTVWILLQAAVVAGFAVTQWIGRR